MTKRRQQKTELKSLALPIYSHEQEIVETIRQHRVVIVEGPTGSGKTTQLPRILLRNDFLGTKMIGLTQPRRIAAVSVAWRIAEEEGVELGHEVGYAIRFDDLTSNRTQVKVMTDGILLQEARTDPEFSAYSIIIVDEAHERSLNIDFILGLLHRAMTRRDDLKVIVSSATMKPETFMHFFEDVAGHVPMLSIQARTYPVQIRHQPVVDEDAKGIVTAAADEILRIHRRDRLDPKEDGGHILAFLPGEGMIRDLETALQSPRKPKQMEILPLFGRLTREEQERVFLPFPNRRKVILATNIAETSITIPGIRYVVDSGLAKIPRVHSETGITTLREEGISRASADQRAGRSGRTAPGETVRLYTKQEFLNRPLFTDEEMNRLDLSEVVLRLIDLGVKEVEKFPFPAPPLPEKVDAAMTRLETMSAIDHERNLTHIGQRMVPFPLAPPLARMTVEAADRFPDVVEDVLIVGAFLSGRNPFLFPAGYEEAARKAQRALAHPMGDSLTAVHLYRRWKKSNNPDGFCEAHFLDPQVMAFIGKSHEQLCDIARNHGIQIQGGGSEQSITRCLAAGFPDRFLMLKGRHYLGPGDVKVAVHPSSVLFGKRHRFVIAGEIVISRRPFARNVSVVAPGWIAEFNPGLARHWQIRTPSRKRQRLERVHDLPTDLKLGDVTLLTRARRGIITVNIELEQIERLKSLDFSLVPPECLRFKARIVTGAYKFAVGSQLGILLAQLPHLPLPAAREVPAKDVPLDSLIDAERDLHLLERYLHRLLSPTLPVRGKRPGWLTLCSNGAGTFWFSVVRDFLEVLEKTTEGLEELADMLPSEDALHLTLDKQLAHVREESASIHERIARLYARSHKG